MALDLRRVSIGFQGGQVLALRLPDEELKALERALEGGGWVEVKGEDGPVRLYLGQVVYISAESAEPHVGFG
ncbi:MAG TPA: hypothetical protein VMI13_13110 [Solirubrobacteraceae bacterium]|nr:hypothetical protein [Solirubrobacteraceae bacterium]